MPKAILSSGRIHAALLVIFAAFSQSPANAQTSGLIELWGGYNSGAKVTQCTETADVFDDLCYDFQQACQSFISETWLPLNDFELSANYNAAGKLQDYDCYVDPSGPVLPGTFFINRWCWDPETDDAYLSNVPCNPPIDPEPECGEGVGNPVNVTNGNKFAEELDFASAGPNVLALRRYYSSWSPLSSETFGYGWRTNFDRTVFVASNGTNGYLRRENGQEIPFVKSGGVWSLAADHDNINFALAEITGGYEVTTPNQTVEEYDSAGKLLSVTWPNSYEQSLTYDTNGKLIEVEDSYSRTITFTYLSFPNYVSTITDPDGEVYSYAYDTAAYALTTVSHPDGTQIQYTYDDEEHPTGITGLIDENGATYASWSYDQLGRAVSSQHAGGVDLTTLAFNSDGTVTVENAYGKEAIYTFADVQSYSRITEVAGQASAHCLAADTDLTYDSNGYVNGVTDREGNITEIVNDSRGLPTSVTEADGTGIERTITTTWHTTYRVPTQIVAPELTTDFTYDSAGNLLTRTETDTTTHTPSPTRPTARPGPGLTPTRPRASF